MCSSVRRVKLNKSKIFSTLFRMFSLSKWNIAIVAAFLIFPSSAYSEPQNEYTAFHFLSPGAREIAIPDTATMEEVLEVFRSNNISFNGPRRILVDDGTGRQVVVGYRLTVELTTYNPGGTTDPRCPYKQITEMVYGQRYRLQEYRVMFFKPCIK